MADDVACAFMSYVNEADEHLGGALTGFRERLESEVYLQSTLLIRRANRLTLGSWSGR
jgi:hypothetical protein